jgi:hypothetical protein
MKIKSMGTKIKKMQQLYQWLLFVIFFMGMPHNKLESNAKFKSKIHIYKGKLKMLLSFHTQQQESKLK